jgi:hypothetical protein
MADMKIGAYICKGCGLGERLDTAQLEMIAKREGKAQVVKSHDFLCNASGVQMIRDDIAKEGVNHVVIAACSRRAKTEAFNFDDVAMSRANLREGVIWIPRRATRPGDWSRRWRPTTCAWAAPRSPGCSRPSRIRTTATTSVSWWWAGA